MTVAQATEDDIYDWVDEMFHAGKFQAVDDAIKGTDLAATETGILLAIITSTLPAKSKLPNRKRLYSEGLRRMGPETMAGLG